MKSFKEVYEMGTDEYANYVKKMTPGQNEGYEGEVTKILKKKGIDGYFKNNKLMVSKRDKDAAMKALKKKSHKLDMPDIQVESAHVTEYGDHWNLSEKRRGPTGIAYSTNPIHLKDISKMLKDRKFKGNTSGLMRAVKAKYPDAYDDPKVQDAFKKHAETNENRLKRMTPIQRAALAKAKGAPKDKVSLAKMPFDIGNKKKQKPKVGRGSEIVRYEEVENIEESTSFTGTQHVQLTRYSATGGLGLQITQTKTMPGMQRKLTGAYVNIPMKDVPKLMKSLQRVFKADIKDPGDDI